MDRAARAEVDGPIELLEFFEVDDCRDDASESSGVIVEPARKVYPGAVLGTCHERFAHEESRRGAIPLSYEVRAVREVKMGWRRSARAVALYALRVDDREQAHLPHPRRAVRKYFVQARRLDVAAIALIPARRIAQQQIDTLPGPRGLLGERLGHVAELAIGGDERIVIRAPGVVRGRTGKGENDQNAEHDRPEPQTLEPD